MPAINEASPWFVNTSNKFFEFFLTSPMDEYPTKTFGKKPFLLSQEVL
jgi:hypothetical protein